MGKPLVKTGAEDFAAGWGEFPAQTWPDVFLVRNSTDFSVPNGGAFTSVWNTKDIDTLNCYNTTDGRFTPSKAGWWRLHLLYTITGGAAGIGFDVQKNGSELFSMFYSSASVAIVSGSALVPFNGTTDYVVSRFSNFSGATRTIQVASNGARFWGEWVRPL